MRRLLETVTVYEARLVVYLVLYVQIEVIEIGA